MSGDAEPEPLTDEEQGSIGTGVRALVEAAPPITLDEIHNRPRPAQLPTDRSTVAWRLAAAAAVLVVLIGAGLAWRQRDGDPPVLGSRPTGVLLPVPADPTGPAAAKNTGARAGVGEPLPDATPAQWDVVRTGADDRQLVVFFAPDAGCSDYRADVTETSEAVAIALLPVPRPDGGDICVAVGGGTGAIGIELGEPLGTRRLEGSRAVIGNDVPGPLVVRGEALANLEWPPGATRATTENLVRGLGPTSYVWTQSFVDDSVLIEPPADSSDFPRNPSLSLEQWYGATPIDEGAGVQACRFQQPGSVEPTQVDGAPATLIRCASTEARGADRVGAIAVMWMDGDDRLTLRAEPGSLDVDGLLALAATVRRGG